MLLLIVLSFLVIAILDFKGYLMLDYNTDQYISRSFLLIGYSIVYLISGVILFVSASISTNSLIKSFSDRDYIAKELRQFIETVNSPIFGIDTKGLINEWNQAAEQITGYKKDEVLGSDWIKFIPKSSGETAIKVVNEALKGNQSNNFEFITRAKNGWEIILLVNTTKRRDTAGEITGVLVIGKDITELAGYRNELELKVDQRTLKLNEALEKQKELNELKSRFVSTTSHEFRTPLAAINFAAGAIKKYWAKMEPEMIKKKLTKIEDQVAFMAQLLDDILIISQADAGKMRNNPLPINLGDFISEIIEEVSISFKKSHEIVLIDSEKLATGTLFIDEKLGRNIFINLLSNAVKFSPDAKKVVIQLSSEEKYTIISITDFGIGIPKSELKNIFTPFTRGKNVDLIQGTGLGLSIVKEAIAVIGGKIILNSTEGDGTSFVVKIPKI
jgi:PAS domain S-box-containing protein